MSRILVVDDEPGVISLLQRMLSSEGHEVIPALTGEDALQAIESSPPDLIIIDVRLGGLSGLETVRGIKLVAPKVPVILVTGFGSTATAIEAIKLGAYDYVTKPFDIPRFRELVRKALANGSPIKSPATPESEYGALEVELIGSAPTMCEVYKLVGRIAPSSVTVLIQGESGTGKELLARTIHRHSQRLAKPFVTVNSAAIPETLLESELFGYEKGAFTGAARRTAGKFEQAHLGTLFLDEIGDLSASAQAKVLRVLEERTFERLGGSEPVCVDVRVLAATNRDLEELVHQGSFREDLYHRLNVIRITLPALRDRKQDIPQLAAHFLRKHGAALGKEGVLLWSEALDVLEAHDWPGNVRELEHCIKQAILLSKGDFVDVECLRLRFSGQRPRSHACPSLRDLARTYLVSMPGLAHQCLLEQAETEIIREALQHTQGNLARAAKLLGISRPTVREKIARYRLLREVRLVKAPDQSMTSLEH